VKATTPTFEELLRRSELATVIRRPSLERALRRAGVDPSTLGPAELQRALHAIRMTLRVYHPPDTAERCFAAIVALAEGET
jgi:hypothetical protein